MAFTKATHYRLEQGVSRYTRYNVSNIFLFLSDFQINEQCPRQPTVFLNQICCEPTFQLLRSCRQSRTKTKTNRKNQVYSVTPTGTQIVSSLHLSTFHHNYPKWFSPQSKSKAHAACEDGHLEEPKSNTA